MEKDKQHLKEDAFAKKYLKEIKLQQPTANFTNNIMNVLAKEEEFTVAKNQPLISKKVWLLVASFVGVCIYVVFKDQKSSGISFPEVDFNFMSNLEMPNLFSSVSVSNSMVLIFALFTLFFLVQVFFLSNHFDKRLKL